MSTQVVMPFAIGQVMWMAAHQPRKVTKPCPVCFGHLEVKVILGNGELATVPCDACGLGFNGPQGTVEEYEYDPQVEQFIIAGVQSMYNDRWYVVSTTGATCDFNDLWDTKELAETRALLNAHEQRERNMQTLQTKKKSIQRHGWSVRYHRDKIKDLERQIAWHKSRIEGQS